MEESKQPLWVRIIKWPAVACLAFVVISVGLSFYSVWDKFIGRSPNTAAQNMLQQAALAQVAYSMDHEGDFAADWTGLAEYGFRPDPNIRVLMVVIDLDWGAGKLSGFCFKANHADDSKVYVYNNISGSGVELARGLKPLGNEYAVVVVSGEEKGEPIRLGGSPVLIIKMSLPEPAGRQGAKS